MSKGPTFKERSDRGDCFSLGCHRKPKHPIKFNNQDVNACDGHRSADGLFCTE